LSTGHGIVRFRSLWAPMGPLARTAIIAAVFALVIVLISSRGLISALLTPSADVSEAGAGDQKQREELYKKSFENHLAQINGRSMFFIPPAPRRAEGPKPADPGPSAPTSYAGPALVGFANGAAYFADGRKLGPDDAKVGTLRVIALNPPWGVTVEWEGIEFTVSLFDRDRVVLSDNKRSAQFPEPPPENPKPTTGTPASNVPETATPPSSPGPVSPGEIRPPPSPEGAKSPPATPEPK